MLAHCDAEKNAGGVHFITQVRSALRAPPDAANAAPLSLDIVLSKGPEMETMVSIFALLVAILSAAFAGFSWKSARKANRISIETALRSDRQQLYRLARRFTLYCSEYPAQLNISEVVGSDALDKNRQSFVRESEELGPVGIPWAATMIAEISGHAEELQRTIDSARSLQEDRRDNDSLRYSDEIEWFARRHRQLQQDFQPYLEIGSTTSRSSASHASRPTGLG
jgi:hypothetical protein